MKKNYTHISVVLDRSGSMTTIADDTIGGFNMFLKSQKETEGTATMTLAQFDDEFDYIYEMTDVNLCSDLTHKTYVPRGLTALLDSIGKVINDTGRALSQKPEDERPEKVILVIITDGFENSSKEFKKAQIANMIKHQEDKYNWEIVYLGANQDAIQEGGMMGFAMDKSMTFDASSKGIVSAYMSLAKNTTKYRACATNTMSFESTDYEEQDKLLGKTA